MEDAKAVILKENGLEILEESTKAALIAFIKAAPALAKLTETTIDDTVVAMLPLVQGTLLDLVELINPADNE